MTSTVVDTAKVEEAAATHLKVAPGQRGAAASSFTFMTARGYVRRSSVTRRAAECRAVPRGAASAEWWPTRRRGCRTGQDETRGGHDDL
jgi:hypothetical protein